MLFFILFDFIFYFSPCYTKIKAFNLRRDLHVSLVCFVSFPFLSFHRPSHGQRLPDRTHCLGSRFRRHQVAAALTQKLERSYRLPIYERLATPLPARWDLAALEELRRNSQASLLLAIRLDTVQEFTYSHGVYDDDTLVSIRLQGTLFCLSDNPNFTNQTRKLNIWDVQPLSVNSGVEHRLFSEVDAWLLRIKEEQLRLRAAQTSAAPAASN